MGAGDHFVLRDLRTQASREPRARGRPTLVLDRYRLVRRLGAGAFGTVWIAHDERLQRDVAVKRMPRERVIGGRLEREAQAAARLAHPGIVTLFEAAVDDDYAYLVSELVRGSTLAELLRAGRLSDRDVAAVGIALCDALAHAHARGVVHRDVKPSNVLVPETPATPGGLAKLTDFGVASLIGGDSLTQTGDVLGTAAYMAPEQAAGRPAGPPADLYALAVVLHEALTGVNPVQAVSPAQRARRLGAYLPPLRRRRRDLPRALGCAIDLGLRPRPGERGTVAQLRQALADSLQRLDDTPRVTRARRPPPIDQPAILSGSANRVDQRASAAWPGRAAAALAAAALTAWLTAHLLAPPPIPPASAALMAAALVLAFPRAGWIALTALLALGAAAAHRPGASLVIVLGALAPVALLPRDGTAWPLAVAAPGLGTVGLAGAWPAIAGRAGGLWRRGALGVAGWVWLAIGGSLVGKDVYLHRAAGAPPTGVWSASPGSAAHDLIWPLVSSGVLLAGVVWALAAVALPWLVRGGSLLVDAVAAVLWSVLLCAATIAALDAGHHVDTPPSVALGATACAAVALAPTILRAWRSRGESQSRAADLRSMESPLTL